MSPDKKRIGLIYTDIEGKLLIASMDSDLVLNPDRCNLSILVPRSWLLEDYTTEKYKFLKPRISDQALQILVKEMSYRYSRDEIKEKRSLWAKTEYGSYHFNEANILLSFDITVGQMYIIDTTWASR